MAKFFKLFGGVTLLTLLPGVVGAAGTYYTGNYQSPQQSRYTQKSYANSYTNNAATRSGMYTASGVSAYNKNRYATAGYTAARVNQNAAQETSKSVVNNATKNGLYLNAGMSKQTAMWQFEMNNAGSKLHYDNIDWLVLDVGGKYVFDAGRAKMQIDAGLQYGFQMGETTMIDDDISHGGYIDSQYEFAEEGFIGTVYGHALSTGTSKDGSMFGFNAGLGLTDIWQIGNLKITPSIGWRHLKYSLETSNNFGMVVMTGDFNNMCFQYSDGSTQCSPVMVPYTASGETQFFLPYFLLDLNGKPTEYLEDAYYQMADTAGVQYAGAEGTFYFHLPDVSHSYDVTWSGPYVGLDMQYDINPNNFVVARMELGLPSYKAEGDQPYRVDWAHPKSVEDKAGIGSAFHFGAGANWSTAISDSVSLSIGVTYDYYNVSDADATTYLNPGYFESMFDALVGAYMTKYGITDSAVATDVLLNGSVDLNLQPNATAVYIYDVAANGWKDTVDSEIESFYKSLGVRIGLNARF